MKEAAISTPVAGRATDDDLGAGFAMKRHTFSRGIVNRAVVFSCDPVHHEAHANEKRRKSTAQLVLRRANLRRKETCEPDRAREALFGRKKPQTMKSADRPGLQLRPHDG
jgi:hypothetical protein